MDRALGLLLWLRFTGWLRRLGRNLGTVKGVLLIVLGLFVFVPWFLSALLAQQPGDAEHLADVRRFGPLSLLAYCVLTVLFSTGERAVSFSPAEVNFLFPGPFSRRQLLGYKLAGTLATAVVTALFLTVAMRRHAALVVAGFVGLFLAIVFVQLFTMVVALLASTLSTRAYNRRRQLVLLALAGLVLVALFQVGREAFRLSPVEILDRMDRSPAWQAVLTPLRWYLLAFTAECVWPDLLQWAALGLAVDLALALLVFALDAQYLETAAVASERVYAQWQRLRSGGMTAVVGFSSSSRARWGLPSLPWWGGAGPIAWRQLTAVPRSRGPLIMLVVFTVGLLGPLLASINTEDADLQRPWGLGAVVLGMSLLLTPLIPYDFRGDIDRIDVLKALPLAAPWLAVGQLIAPVAVVAGFQAFALVAVAALTGNADPLLAAAVALTLPFNFFLFGMENLLFLLFPTRLTPATPGDLQALGRQMLLFLAKFASMSLALGLAALVGLGAYLVTRHSVLAAFLGGWLTLTACAAGVVPLIAWAFRQFDVTRDLPP